MTSKLELFKPVASGWISQGFGSNGEWYRARGINIQGHNGLDFAGCEGYNVRASHDGVVLYAGKSDTGGNMVEIVSNEQFDMLGKIGFACTVYMHMRDGSLCLKTGDTVLAGDRLGIVGNTGLSTGPHLHFGLKRVLPNVGKSEWITQDYTNGYLGSIDPLPHLSKYNASDAQHIITTMEKIIRTAKAVIEKLKELAKNKIYA